MGIDKTSQRFFLLRKSIEKRITGIVNMAALPAMSFFYAPR
jgi:hypothetical protein